MSLVFYFSPQSSASPVRWTLEELGVPHQKVQIDLKAGEQKKPEFLKLNPNGRVPLLVHDGTPIFESAAIQIYLGETFGVDKGLYPPPGPKRGEVMKWIVWTNATLGEAMSRVGRNLGPWAPEDERNAKAGATAKAEVEGLLRIVEDTLADRSYLTGENLTIADLHLSSWMDYARMMQIDLAPFPKLSAWVARCISRPSYKVAE
ncbi:MAG: glutathione S-transferase family protein [Polyangia bacterium]